MAQKDPLIHFPFYCNQYLGMLAKYTYEEQGAFMRIVATYIAEDGHVSCDNPTVRYRLFSAFTPTEQTALNAVFGDAIELAKEIIKKQKFIREKKRAAGKKGGRPTAKKTQEKSDLNGENKDNLMVNLMDNLMVNHKAKQSETISEPRQKQKQNTETETDENLHHDASNNNIDTLEENFCPDCFTPIGDGFVCPNCQKEVNDE